MSYHSPLRYPGGKRRLVNSIASIWMENDLGDGVYAEAYAGGASIALHLLMEEYASRIYLNDLSPAIFSFWDAALNNTKELCRRILRTRITIREWHRQRSILDGADSACREKLAFATLFLNRTNRSGILTGGVIGGKGQCGQWDLTVRFNREDLVRRIESIGRMRSRVVLSNLDALDFAKNVAAKLPRRSLVFYDPPYIDAGKGLYLNEYTIEGHRAVARQVHSQSTPWVVVYDAAALRYRLYSQFRRLVYFLHYTAQGRHLGREVMFFSSNLKLPEKAELMAEKMHLARGTRL